MSTGLLALLDDIVGIAKVAAASLDDVAGQAAKAGVKAAGVVIDDAAVTPRYVFGFAANRELPIVGKIAVGSLKNKLLYLLPIALVLSLVAPWAITPLLMLGGFYLCYEGAEKVYGALMPHAAHQHEEKVGAAPRDPRQLENQKVRSAIQTDFILSAEIMALTLGSASESSIFVQAAVLAVVGVGITALVYGGVALIVKADDAGLALAKRDGQPGIQAVGRAIVRGMPGFLKGLGIVGTAAMIWVGGGIIIHGLEELGLDWPAHPIHEAAVAVGEALHAIAGLAEWLVSASLAGVAGLLIGAALIPIVQYGIAPAFAAVKRRLRGAGGDGPSAPH